MGTNKTESADPRRFILWDPRDGYTRWNGDTGECESDGLFGRIGIDNVYISTYPTFSKHESRRPKDLAVGEVVEATYSLSGSKGTYEIIRVK